MYNMLKSWAFSYAVFTNLLETIKKYLTRFYHWFKIEIEYHSILCREITWGYQRENNRHRSSGGRAGKNRASYWNPAQFGHSRARSVGDLPGGRSHYLAQGWDELRILWQFQRPFWVQRKECLPRMRKASVQSVKITRVCCIILQQTLFYCFLFSLCLVPSGSRM